MGRRGMVAVGLAVMVGTAGCGGAGGSKASSPTSAPAATRARFCQLSDTFNRRLSALLQSVAEDPSQIRRFVGELVAVSKESAAAAPTEIAADARLITGAAADYAEALDRAGFDPAMIPPDAAAALSRPEVQAASQRVEAYSTTSCATDR